MFLGGRVSVESGFPEICLDSGISRIVEASGYLSMEEFQNILKILDFLLANLGIPDKSMISDRYFLNIREILDFLLANFGNPDKSMISGRFPQAKPFENRNFSPRKHFPEKLNFLGEMFLGEKFLEGNVSGG